MAQLPMESPPAYQPRQHVGISRLLVRGQQQKINQKMVQKIEKFRSIFGNFLGVLEFTPITAGFV